jgi:hypothetical protein
MVLVVNKKRCAELVGEIDDITAGNRQPPTGIGAGIVGEQVPGEDAHVAGMLAEKMSHVRTLRRNIARPDPFCAAWLRATGKKPAQNVFHVLVAERH